MREVLVRAERVNRRYPGTGDARTFPLCLLYPGVRRMTSSRPEIPSPMSACGAAS